MGSYPGLFIARKFQITKKKLKLLNDMPARASCKELKVFKHEGILILPALNISQVLIFFKENPQYLKNCIFTHEYETRHKNRMQLEKHNITHHCKKKGLLYPLTINYSNIFTKRKKITCIQKEIEIVFVGKKIVQNFRLLI